MTLDPAIRTVDHDKEWPRIFDAEKTWLKAPLGDVAERMKHVGSPPVPGLAAKPIIDIDVYVKAIEPMRPCREPLERLGYLFVFDPEFLNLHFFGYPEKRPGASTSTWRWSEADTKPGIWRCATSSARIPARPPIMSSSRGR